LTDKHTYRDPDIYTNRKSERHAEKNRLADRNTDANSNTGTLRQRNIQTYTHTNIHIYR